jgi:hypothetical protein
LFGVHGGWVVTAATGVAAAACAAGLIWVTAAAAVGLAHKRAAAAARPATRNVWNIKSFFCAVELIDTLRVLRLD